jgi:hypothetical protein
MASHDCLSYCRSISTHVVDEELTRRIQKLGSHGSGHYVRLHPISNLDRSFREPVSRLPLELNGVSLRTRLVTSRFYQDATRI